MTEELKQAALEACPFCGADPQDAHHIEYGRWAVTCRCGASGASANTGPNATDAAKIKAYSDARIAWNTRALTQRPAVQAGCNHVLYETTDADRPKEICDRNGEVVLAMCKLCSKAEAELETTPPAAQATPEPVGEVVYQLQSGDGKWIDQTRASYDYNVKHGNTVRILHTRPAPGVPEDVLAILDECRNALMECDRDGDYALIDRIDALAAAQAKGVDPEDLAAAGVMLMGRREHE